MYSSPHGRRMVVLDKLTTPSCYTARKEQHCLIGTCIIIIHAYFNPGLFVSAWSLTGIQEPWTRQVNNDLERKKRFKKRHRFNFCNSFFFIRCVIWSSCGFWPGPWSWSDTPTNIPVLHCMGGKRPKVGRCLYHYHSYTSTDSVLVHHVRSCPMSAVPLSHRRTSLSPPSTIPNHQPPSYCFAHHLKISTHL